MVFMDLMKLNFLAWVTCFLYLSFHIRDNVVEGGRTLSKHEDIELEKQLKRLNKPAVKTIQTENGDIFDCVDFYKQPAFDHPLLKNHTFHFQMESSTVPEMMKEKEPFKNNINVSHVKFQSLGCPSGSVPIRRVTKDELIRAKLQANTYNFSRHSNFSLLTSENPGTHYSVVRTKFDPSKRYNGGGTYTSIYNPYVEPSQSSSSRIVISSGTDSVEGGWTVNPALFGSGDTRLYIQMKTSNTQCINTECGFVIVNPDIPLGSYLTISQRGVLPTSLLGIIIYRDSSTGDWWLGVAGARKPIGFWPRKMFVGLAEMATKVEWGGVVTGPPNVPSCSMGSGEYLQDDMKYDAFHRDMSTISESRELIDVQNTEVYNDNDGYQVVDAGTWKAFIFRIMFFGGPGKSTGN